MGARCHADSCSIQWSEIVEGGVRKFKADVHYDTTLKCDGSNLGVHLDPSSEAITGFLPGDPLNNEWLTVSNSGIKVNSEFRGKHLVKHIAFSDAPANNPFSGLEANRESGDPDYGSGEFEITNDTGREGLLLITGMYELYYDIRPGVPSLPPNIPPGFSGNAPTGRIEVEAQTLPIVGSIDAREMVPYNAQIAMGIVLKNSPSPTYPANVAQRHEFDISGLVFAPPTEDDTLGRQYKSSKAAFVYQVNIPGNATFHWRCFAFHNGSGQLTNVNLTPASSGNPRRGFRISEVTASIIPIPVNETIEA